MAQAEVALGGVLCILEVTDAQISGRLINVGE